jgi:hypothetical protein
LEDTVNLTLGAPAVPERSSAPLDLLRVMRRGIAAAGIATALLLGPIACGTGVVSKDEVATTSASALQGQGVQVENMTCPGDLEAVAGQSIRCEFTTGGQPVDAVVTITSVENGTARYDVHTEARPVPKALLDQRVAETLREQADIAVDSSNCAGDLQPQVGSSVGCEVTSGSESAEFTVSVTSIDGGLINFSIEQA